MKKRQNINFLEIDLKNTKGLFNENDYTKNDSIQNLLNKFFNKIGYEFEKIKRLYLFK